MLDSPTLAAIQTLGDGVFHRLADEVLRHLHSELRALKPNGINKEGKAVSGVPDSYVGPSPQWCSIAVEYTTYQHAKLGRKLTEDLEGVIARCPKLRKVYLCTNRPRKAGLDTELAERAGRARKDLEIIWGEDISRVLDAERQDLRWKYLSIPLRALSPHSIIPTLKDRLGQTLEAHLSREDQRTLLGRLQSRGLEKRFNTLQPSKRTGITLVLGDAGLGKTTWSATAATRASENTPVVWFPAKTLGEQWIDAGIVAAIWGTNDATRVDELAQLLPSVGQKLLVFIDAIDEHRDYERFQQELARFLGQSPLARRTHIVLTCRNEALTSFERASINRLPPAATRDDARRLYLERLREDESCQLLSRHGATIADIGAIRRMLPSEFFGNPLYLKLALALRHSGMEIEEGGKTWLHEFARHLVDQIVARLRKHGVEPSADAVRRSLGHLAYLAIRDSRGADPNEINDEPLIGPDMIGEGTLLEQAVQVGLLTRNHARLRFRHALFCEYFVAERIVRNHEQPRREQVAEIARLPGRASIANFAVVLDPALALEFAESQPALVTGLHLATSDSAAQGTLVARATDLLKSRYPSDRAAGRHILASIGTPLAISAAVDWYNSLGDRKRIRDVHEAADLFLRLQLPQAVAVVSHCVDFWMPPSHPWYRREVAKRIDALSPTFRQTLADYTVKALEKESTESEAAARYTGILTYLRDARLLQRLNHKSAQGILQKHEHRALIHFNTDDAMEIYCASRQHHYVAMDAVSAADESGSRRARLWYNLIPMQSDVVEFPHDALLRVVGRDLKSSRTTDLRFALDWCGTLQPVDLIDDYARATAGDAGVFAIPAREMIRNIVMGLDNDGVVELFARVATIEAKRKILEAAGRVPGAKVENLLLSALENRELFTSACVGLTELRSQLAGPRLHTSLSKLKGRDRHLVVKALGRIRYEPALPDLIGLLENPKKGRSAKNGESAYDLLMAVGQIGGEAAYDTLARQFRSDPNEICLAFLLDAHHSYATAKVHELLAEVPETKELLVDALCHREFLHDDVHYYDRYESPPEFVDEAILGAVLDKARSDFKTSSPHSSFLLMKRNCDAVALFEGPKVTKFFEELAGLEVEAQEPGECILFARRTLGRRGNLKWASAAVQHELDDILSSEFEITDHDLESLREWPESVVRQVLLERIRSNPSKRSKLIDLLTTFALPEDESVLRESLADVDEYVADAIRDRITTTV